MRNKISVIIPSYNRSGYILESIQSVLVQNVESLEIIVVDDGSTDNTKEVLASLIDKGLIRYVYQENHGRSVARNRGISLATGDYIAFLDSDDLFEPGKLTRQLDLFKEHPEVGLVHGGYEKFTGVDKDLGYRDPSWFQGWIYPDILLIWYTLLATPTVMVPKQVLEAVGGFDESMFIAEDLDLWRRIARKYPFGYINGCLARIRVHSGNTSRDVLNTTREFERYLEKAFLDDESLSVRFRQRVFSRMYTNQAYMMLGCDGEELMAHARTLSRRAIMNDVLNIHGYITFLSTILSHDLRKIFVKRWRLLRSSIMLLRRRD